MNQYYLEIVYSTVNLAKEDSHISTKEEGMTRVHQLISSWREKNKLVLWDWEKSDRQNRNVIKHKDELDDMDDDEEEDEDKEHSNNDDEDQDKKLDDEKQGRGEGSDGYVDGVEEDKNKQKSMESGNIIDVAVSSIQVSTINTNTCFPTIRSEHVRIQDQAAQVRQRFCAVDYSCI